MVISLRIFLTALCTAAMFSSIAVLVQGSPKTDFANASQTNCTTRISRCCKLGRKAARHNSISPIYTCYYEALIAGLDHQTSVANRLRATKGRWTHMKNIAKATAFRSRLASCFSGQHKKCFESCCIAKRERLRKMAKQKKRLPIGLPQI